MYPQSDLDLLSRRKLNLLSRINARRDECAEQVEQVLQPVLWVERVYAKWRAISPILKMAIVPLGLFFLRRKAPPKTESMIGGLFRWAPVALNLFRSMR